MKNYVNSCIDQSSNKIIKNINDIFRKYMKKSSRKETVKEEQIDSVQEP